MGGVVGLAMVRNPLSWLDSFDRVAYDLRLCRREFAGSNWFKKPCTFRPETSSDSFLAGKTYDNVEKIWNMWNTDYQSLASYGFSKNILIRYEDLVENTTEILSKIASIAGLEVPAKIYQEDVNMSPTSGPDNGNGRNAALSKLDHKSYLH